MRRFPLRLNYYFRHEGWQFIGLDTSEGLKYEKTSVPAATLGWLDEYLPRLAPRKPTVVFTHFPLGAGVNYRPLNAEDVLYRFRDFNLQAVFCGHYHAGPVFFYNQRVDTPRPFCRIGLCHYQVHRGSTAIRNPVLRADDHSTHREYFLCGSRNHIFHRLKKPGAID